jgi:HSP20 family protein
MLTRWNDFDRTFAALDEFRRRMDRLWDEVETGYDGPATATTWPRSNLYDTGAALVLQVELPGLAENDIKLTLNQEALTLSGERRRDVPEGYSVHRQERGTVRFSRSFQFPCKIDPERVTATTRNGILTVTLAKTPESQPRSIAVKAQA